MIISCPPPAVNNALHDKSFPTFVAGHWLYQGIFTVAMARENQYLEVDLTTGVRPLVSRFLDLLMLTRLKMILWSA